MLNAPATGEIRAYGRILDHTAALEAFIENQYVASGIKPLRT